MSRSDFEAALGRDGYDRSEGTIEPNTHRELHTHDVDITLYVESGTLTLQYEADRQSFGPGQTCSLPAGTLHAEHTGPDGVSYVAGRRAPAPATLA